jgi:hypothetical protein
MGSAKPSTFSRIDTFTSNWHTPFAQRRDAEILLRKTRIVHQLGAYFRALI